MDVLGGAGIGECSVVGLKGWWGWWLCMGISCVRLASTIGVLFFCAALGRIFEWGVGCSRFVGSLPLDWMLLVLLIAFSPVMGLGGQGHCGM